MKIKNLMLILVMAVSGIIIPAESRVVADISSVQVEGNTFRARGVKLTNRNNPAKAWVTDLSGNNKTNIPIAVNGKRTAVFVTMPLVEEDTKMNLFISGGNIAEADAQKTFIVVLNDPGLNVTTLSDVPSVVTTDGSSVGGTGSQGPAGPSGPQGPSGFVYGGNRDVDTLPDYSEEYYDSIPRNKLIGRKNLEGGEVDFGASNAVTIIDSNSNTDDIVALLKGSGATGQRVSFIVNDFFFLALSNFRGNNRNGAPVEGSIVFPEFQARPVFATQAVRTVEVNPYQLMPVFPGQVLEFMYDGFQWRLLNTPFFGIFGPCGPFSECD